MKIDYAEQQQMQEEGTALLNSMFDEAVEQHYRFSPPAGGFDLGSWTALYDNFFPVMQEHPQLAEYLLRAAPAGVTHETRLTLKLAAGLPLDQ